MGPLESRNDFALVFFRKDFHPSESFTLKFHFEKSRPGRARVKSKHLQQKVHQIGWFCLFELRMGPLESRNDFAMVFFRKDFHPRRKLHPQISL